MSPSLVCRPFFVFVTPRCPLTVECLHVSINTLTAGNCEVSRRVTRGIHAGRCTAQSRFRDANASRVHMHREGCGCAQETRGREYNAGNAMEYRDGGDNAEKITSGMTESGWVQPRKDQGDGRSNRRETNSEEQTKDGRMLKSCRSIPAVVVCTRICCVITTLFLSLCVSRDAKESLLSAAQTNARGGEYHATGMISGKRVSWAERRALAAHLVVVAFTKARRITGEKNAAPHLKQHSENAEAIRGWHSRERCRAEDASSTDWSIQWRKKREGGNGRDFAIAFSGFMSTSAVVFVEIKEISGRDLR